MGLVHSGQAAKAPLQLLQDGMTGRPVSRILKLGCKCPRIVLQRMQVSPQGLPDTKLPQ
jgi:hypothetical protein